MRMGLALIGMLLAGPAYGMDREAYEAKHSMVTGDEGQKAAVQKCLAAWGKHPFDTEKTLRFRVIEPKVRVMGLGAQETRDEDTTDKPVLILVEPSVNVMTKTTYGLLNPNGWYCFDASVTVMGKALIKAHCDTKIADARSGAAVIAHSDSEKDGVTVLGSTRVEREQCPTE